MVDVGGRCDQARVGTEANGRNGEGLRDRAEECDETVERSGVREERQVRASIIRFVNFRNTPSPTLRRVD